MCIYLKVLEPIQQKFCLLIDRSEVGMFSLLVPGSLWVANVMGKSWGWGGKVRRELINIYMQGAVLHSALNKWSF